MHIEKMSAMPLMDAFVEVLIKLRIKTKKKANVKRTRHTRNLMRLDT